MTLRGEVETTDAMALAAEPAGAVEARGLR